MDRSEMYYLSQTPPGYHLELFNAGLIRSLGGSPSHFMTPESVSLKRATAYQSFIST
jgi:hypothetical protein